MVTWAEIEGNPENNDDLMNLFDGKSNKIVDRKDLNGNYTLQEEDTDHLLVMTQEGDFTVPADELPVNSAVVLTKSTGDDVNIIAGSGVTFLPTAGGYVIPEEWIFITLFHASQNTWVLQGTVSDDLQALLDEKADKGGDDSQEFSVAPASQNEHAPQLSQVNNLLTGIKQGVSVKLQNSATIRLTFNENATAIIIASWTHTGTSTGSADRILLRQGVVISRHPTNPSFFETVSHIPAVDRGDIHITGSGHNMDFEKVAGSAGTGGGTFQILVLSATPNRISLSVL